MIRTAGVVCSTRVRGEPISFFVTDPADVIQACHHDGRFYEPEELAIISEFFAPGGVFVDVGANVGNHAVFVAKFLRPAQVIVFEPNPEARRLMEINLALNGLQSLVDVSLVAFGLSDASGEAVVQPRYHRNLGAAQLRPIEPGAEDGAVEVRRGDDLLAGRPVDFLKIDVEGMEIDVLRGLRGVIAQRRPHIFIEIEATRESAFHAFVQASGYQVRRTFERYEKQVNYMLTHPDRGAP